MVLDDRFVERIRQIGFHPFILARFIDMQPPVEEYVVCLTQNEAPQFVNALNAMPAFVDSKLLRGVERGLQLETYDAADLFFSWVEAGGRLDEALYVGLGEGTDLPFYFGYPVFELGGAGTPQTARERVQLLRCAFEAYAATSGNDALRMALIEALGFGLSRSLGMLGEYAEAAGIVDRALACRPYSIHLKAARHALWLKIEGKEVPERLVKFIGPDNGYLKNFVCPLPFERFDIGPSGDVLVCCGHWLPTTIGNFLKDPLDSVLNSGTAQRIRRSVTDGTYKYCNHLECGAMAQNTLPSRDEIGSPRARRALETGNYRVDAVDQVLFAFDQTCNLSCPSCRSGRIIERGPELASKIQAVEEKLSPLLPGLKVLNLNNAGELFISKPSRRLLELINDERCPDLVLDIISNGMVFNEREWNKFPGIHNKVRSIRISVDAACKATFEKLRRGGRWEIFLENMAFLSGLRERGVIRQFKFSFTYQLDNFREMPEFIEFCNRMKCDFAIFERLQNLGAFTDEEYREKAVHYPSHPLYREFISVIANPIFINERVWHDFDYDGVERLTRERAIRRQVDAQTL